MVINILLYFLSLYFSLLLLLARREVYLKDCTCWALVGTLAAKFALAVIDVSKEVLEGYGIMRTNFHTLIASNTCNRTSPFGHCAFILVDA